jgi:hypothetical protein
MVVLGGAFGMLEKRRNMTSERTITMRTQKKAWLAALLNLIPLVGIGFLVNLLGLHVKIPVVIPPSPLLEFFIIAGCGVTLILWGFGYLYLRRSVRFVVALSVPYLYCAGYIVFPKPSSNLPEFYFPYMSEAVVVFGVLNLLSGIDAWFLGGRQGSHDQEKAPETMTGADKPNMIGLDDPTERERARTLSAKTSSEKPSQEK